MLYIAKPYERYRGMLRPWPPSWMRRRLNLIHVAMNVHPYFINKVDRELDRQSAQRRGTER